MPKHLDRRTDRQHRRSEFRGTLQASVVKQMLGGQPLRVVLGTAEGVEVQRIRHRVGQGDFDDLCGDPAHRQTLSQYDGVSAIAVGAHHIGQDQADSHRGFGHCWRSTTRCNCRNAV